MTKGAESADLAALVELRDKIFGVQAGDEPNVYADYDELCALKRRVDAALEALAAENARLRDALTQVDEWLGKNSNERHFYSPAELHDCVKRALAALPASGPHT